MNITKLSFSIISRIYKVLLVIILALPLNGFSQSIIYVKNDAGGTNNGTSWTNAYTSLQSALDIAASGDSIWVTAGTYKPSKDKDGISATDTSATFMMLDNVFIYGGFAGGEVKRTERNWKTNETILSGDLGSDTSYHVIRGVDNSHLDGFTITNGYANGTVNHNGSGSGMLNDTLDNINVINCTFINNKAKEGGGMANFLCTNMLITNCIFQADTASNGGGLGNWNTRVYLYNCLFANNYAGIDYGGAIYNWGSGSTAQIINCTFYNNKAENSGGTIHNRAPVSTVTNCILWGNDYDIVNTNGGNSTVSYTCIEQSGYAGSNGNISSDPLFDNSATGDFHLTGTSPCIDAGNGDVAPQYDLDGFPRSDDETVSNTGAGTPDYTDMGVYEWTPGVAGVVYVNIDASGSNNGSSWIHAYTDLQSALTTASSGDTIWVAKGTYKPTTGTDRSVSFVMIEGVAIYGGFIGTEAKREDRDWKNNETILSGVLDGVKSYHVVKGNKTARLDGFTITGGYADGGGTDNSGAGMLNYSLVGYENLSIVNCLFDGNKAFDYGGAIYNYHSDAEIINCRFTNNSVEVSSGGAGKGGAIANNISSTPMTNCVFNYNIARGYGGAVHSSAYAQTFINCTFYLNYANERGGSIVDNSVGSTVTNCIFWLNQDNTGYGNFYTEDNSEVPTVTYSCVRHGYTGEGNISSDPYFKSNTDLQITDSSSCIDAANGNIAPDFDVEGKPHLDNTTIDDTGTGTPSYVDIGAYEQYIEAIMDAGVTEIEEPQSPFTTGVNNVIVTFKNFGVYTLSKTNIVFQVGSDSPGTYNWSGTLSPGDSVTSLNIGSYDFPYGLQTIKAWTDSTKYLTNYVADTVSNNDTSIVNNNSCYPLNGTYNIGPSYDIKNFTEAIDTLTNGCGITGAVIFNVESGTYNEHISIPEIIGASATNTITFQSASGDSSDVILSYAAAGEGDNYTLKLDGADYITFKDITIEATGAEYARLIEIGYKADYNTFSNNRLLGVLNKSELVYSNNNYSSYDTCSVFENNLFSNGIRGINMTTGYNLVVSGNEFVNQSEEAIYLHYYRYPEILSNYIHSDAYLTTAILLDNNREQVKVNNNQIILPYGGSGVQIRWCLLATNDTSEIFNNHVYINTEVLEDNRGISTDGLGASYIKIYHNTVHITGSNSSSTCYYYSRHDPCIIKFLNNNLANLAGGTVFSGEVYFSEFASNYNNLYTVTNSDFLNEWQTNQNRDLNSVSVNPYFVEDTTYHIFNPALNGAGTPLVEVTEDLDGDIRNTTNPDIGADEFTPSPAPLSGTYTIAGASPDYETINDAVKDLTINGIDGAVTFNIATDTLNEQIRIFEIVGASGTNTITFQSATGDSSDVLITYTPINTIDKYTVRLDAADYIIFKKLSITSGEEWGWPVELKSEATHNVFEGNKIFMATQASKNVDYALVYAKGSLDSTNVFIGNYFENGSTGIYLEDCASGIQITNNKFINMSFQGIYLRNLINPEITGNYINNSTTASWVHGILLRDIHSVNTEKSLVANNMILTMGGYGIYLYNSNDLSIVYNTVKVNAGSNSFYGEGNNFDILNNIFVINQGSYVAEISDTTDCNIDYNLYYHPNSAYAEMYYSTGYTTDLEQYGFDLHSIKREPVFVSDTDLHTTDPWLNNWGTPLTEVTIDIDGESRDAVNPDVGADEFDGIMPFEGEYTIGSTGDFKSFTEAVDTIGPVGISGPVTFKVESGTYNEQFIITAIPEVTETNTITFQSVSGDSTDVILQFDATSSENYTVKMDSCSFITFQNMTIEALDTTYARVIEFAGGASNNIISNNVLKGLGTTNAVVYSIGDQDNNNQFNNNLITGGKIGIQMFGESASLLESGTKIIGNVFEDQFSEPILLQYQYAPLVLNNQIIHAGLIKDTWVGIYLDECSGNSSNLGLIANNVIAFNTETMSAGIVLSGTSYQKVYHNSVNVYGSTENSRAFNQEEGGSNNILTNNIFNNLSGGLVIYTTDIYSFSSDHNNYYATGDRFIYYGVSGTEFYWISDLATWQTDYSTDLNSYSVDPKFVSDINLLPGNISLDGSGAALTDVTEDFAGIPRDPVNPDIGAYEFIGCTTSGTFTIGSSGADYATFEEAIESLQTCWASGPIIFNVQSGTYSEQVIIPEVPGASETNTITFQSVSGDSTDVILTWASTSADTNYTVKLDGADYISFKNLTLQATGNDYASVITILNGASNNQFHNNRFIGVKVNLFGALVYSPYGNVNNTNNIFNENLFLSGSYGIYFSAHYSVSESNNQLTGNRFEDQVSGGIYLYYQDSALISMNEISNTLSEKDYYGIYFYGTNSQINRNEINLINYRYNCTGVSISGNDETKPSSFSNNFVHINTNGYGNITGINLSYCNSYYNSINITGVHSGSYAIELPNSRSCSLKNNIFLNNAGGNAISYSDGSAANVSSNYNDLYSNGDYLAYYNSTNLADLVEWTAATTFDANSVSIDPMFVSDSNLHTQNPIINGAGTPIAEVTDDIDGDTRDAATPDIGADEFETLLYILGDNINACAYDTVTLDAGNGYDSYSWSNGATTRFADVDTTGVGLDSVKLVSTVMLGGQEYKDSLWISFHKPVAVTFDIDTCEYNYVQLKASGGVSYHWELYVTNPDTCCVSVYLYNTTQNYVVTVYDSYGCYDTDTATVVPFSKPSQPLIQFSNDSLVSSVTGTGYTWFLNSTLEDYTTQAILPQESGDYRVIVYNGGCPSDSSDSYNYIVGIEDLAGNREITLYPNPTDGKLFMSFEKPFKNLRLSVINIEGQVVLSRLLNDVPKGFITELDLGEIPAGLYFIKFTNKEISRTARIIVR